MLNDRNGDTLGGGRWRRRALVAGVLVLLLAALFGTLAWGLANRSPVTGRSGITRVSKDVPTFVLETFDGDRLDLAEQIGRPIVINFWASWCVPCRREAVTLEGAWRASQGTDVLFVGVDIDDTEADARAFVEEFGVSYPNGLDPDGEITVDFGVIGLPVTFFVNREGVIERRWVGEISGAQLALWLDDLVAGRPADERFGENREAFYEIGDSSE